MMNLMGWDAEDSPIKHVALDVTLGKLHRFWYWCLDFAPTGDLRGKNDAVLAGSVGLAPKDGKRFVDAMVQSGWIDRADEIFRVHDWIDYAGRYLKDSKFKRHPNKKRDLQRVYKDPVVCGQSAVPDLTNQPKDTHTAPAREAALAAFNRWAFPEKRRELNPIQNEHRPIFDLIDRANQQPPIVRGRHLTDRGMLVAQAADFAAKSGKPFKSPKYAAAIVFEILEDWALHGIPGASVNGRSKLSVREAREAEIERALESDEEVRF